jgi:hypothetical protein
VNGVTPQFKNRTITTFSHRKTVIKYKDSWVLIGNYDKLARNPKSNITRLIEESKMEFIRKLAKPLTPVIIAAFASLSIFVPSAQAEFISTHSTVEKAELAKTRAKIKRLYHRKDIKVALEKHGISSVEAQKRIDSLTDKEVKLLAKRIDKMPAGAGAEGILVVFLILIILELTGVINMFSFI